jgi:hypothetical protein
MPPGRFVAMNAEEVRRTTIYPGITFQDGPMGRRATLVQGPDVWEIVRAMQSSLVAEPELSEAERLRMLETDTGVPVGLIGVALAYWIMYPDEVNAMIELDRRTEAELSKGYAQLAASMSAEELAERRTTARRRSFSDDDAQAEYDNDPALTQLLERAKMSPTVRRDRER